MASEVYSLIALTLTGLFMSLCYDILRALRRAISFNMVFIWISDFLYWVFVCAFVAYIMLITDDGKINAYEICGMIIGGYFYHITISNYTVRLLSIVFKKITKIITLFFKIVLTPVRFLYKILIRGNVDEQIDKACAQKEGTL